MNGETQMNEAFHDDSAHIEDLTRRLGEVADQLASVERRHEDWLSTVSHDLRGPLTLILGYSDNLLRRARSTRESSRSIHDLEAIISAARRLNKMVSQVVEGARLQNHQIVLSIRPIDLSPVLEKSARTAFKLYPTNRIQSDIPPSLPWVVGDPYAIETISGAFLSNAALFSPSDGPIRLKAEFDQQHVVVSVYDRGSGLSDEERSHVFEPRYRPERALNARREGLGCSLWIARELAALMGGSVEVQSDGPDLGTTATLRLPTLPVSGPQSIGPTFDD
jgi:two-component system, chemotaxis family, CheB/CheR fusion protein